MEVVHPVVGGPGEKVFTFGETLITSFALFITEVLFLLTDFPEKCRIAYINAIVAVKVH
jgi:hypothetical protein